MAKMDEDFQAWRGSHEFARCLEILQKLQYGHIRHDDAISALQIAYESGHARGYNEGWDDAGESNSWDL